MSGLDPRVLSLEIDALKPSVSIEAWRKSVSGHLVHI